jgi:hypothetical protein
VVFTLIKDGDHRLSRPQDLERLVAAVAEARVLAEPVDDDPVARRLARAARARAAGQAPRPPGRRPTWGRGIGACWRRRIVSIHPAIILIF